jgi:hypothetical protein
MVEDGVTHGVVSDVAVRSRVYGVDFSGAQTAGRKIWLARGVIPAYAGTGAALHIDLCARAGEWLGTGGERTACLAGLRELIAREHDSVFGLDFPFSLPRPLVGADTWTEFAGRFPDDYASPEQFRHACYARSAAVGGRELKRHTDRETGTPWAAYNLRLYRQTFYGIGEVLAPLVRRDEARVRPMQAPSPDRAWLIEICPAATLKRHGLYAPYKGTGTAHAGARARLLEAVERLAPLTFASPDLRAVVLSDRDGDALDSVIAAWAVAEALRQSNQLQVNDPVCSIEGSVYV